MQIKLNATMSIGIIASVIWFNCFLGYGLYYGALETSTWLNNVQQRCDVELQSRNDLAILIGRTEDRVAQIAENRTSWTKCRSFVRTVYRQHMLDVYKGLPFLLAEDFATLGFGWLAACLAFLITRRIRRGSA
jgi:hypothetical protein